MNHGLHRLASLALAILGLAGSANAATVTATTDAFRLSIKQDGIRPSAGDETLTYSSRWDGGEGATVTLAQDGAALAEGLTGEGDRAWSVSRNGTYVLTHTTYTNGVAGAVETVTFIVTGKDIPFSATDVTVTDYAGTYDGTLHGVGVTVAEGIADAVVRYATAEDGEFSATPPTLTDAGSMTVWCEIAAPGYITQTNTATVTLAKREVTLTSGSAGKVYDGTALTKHEVTVGGDGFVDGEGASYAYTGSQTEAGSSENTFTYTLNDGTKAGNYAITTVNGTITVTKANAGGGEGGGEEPGGGQVPEGGISTFDTTFMYDGEGHMIDTDALVAAFGGAMIGERSYMYAQAQDPSDTTPPTEGWAADAPAYTNAGEYVVWYRVANPNYVDFVHAAKVMITNRPVTVTSGSGDWTYDGQAHANDTVTVEGFVDGEGIEASNFATITDVGSIANGFDYTFTEGTLAENYAVTCVTGTLTVAAADISGWTDETKWSVTLAGDGAIYDGTEKTCAVTALAYDGFVIPTFTVTGDTATDAGDYTLTITGTGNFVGTHTVPWSIVKRTVTLTSGNAEWTYDGASHSQTVVSVTGDGFAAGEGATYSGFPVARHVVDAADGVVNSFTYTLNAGTKAGNYAITTVNGAVKMLPRAITLTSPVKSKTYDGTPLTFMADEVTVSGDGYADGETFTLGDFAAITEAGRVDATFTVADGTALTGDYAITTVPGTLTVMRNATEITVTAKSGSWVYDGQPHMLQEYEATNLGILKTGDALEVTFSDASVVTTPVDGPAGNGVVTNVITALRVVRNGTDDVTANYTLAQYNGTLTVTKRPVTVTSGSGEWTYDAQAHSNATVTVEGFVDGDGIEADHFVTITDVGSIANGFDYAFAEGTLAENYAVTCVTGTLTVAAADIGGWTDEAKWSVALAGDGAMYDGTEKTCAVTTLAYDGFAIQTFTVGGNTATDAGDYTLTITGTGNFVGTHTVPWTIERRTVTLTSGSAGKVYDGTALVKHEVTVGGDGFAEGEGASYAYTGTQTDIGESENTFTYTLNTGTKAGNYAITTANGTLTVTKASVGGENGEEPGGGEVPEGGISAFDTTVMYDGEGHTIDTDALAAAFGGAMVGERSCMYAQAPDQSDTTPPTAGWTADAPAYTNVGEYVVWYRVANPNYEDFVHAAKVTITNRPVTVTSGSGEWTYDGQAHANDTVTVEGFVDGEGVEASNFATITDVGSIANGFDYTFTEGTLAENYAVTCVTGTLTVAAADIGGWTDETKWSVTLAGDGAIYDGTEKTCAVTTLAYDGFAIPTFTVTGDTATDAGDYTLTITGTGNFVGAHTVPWSIVKRTVTLTSGSAGKVYDGTELTKHEVTVGGDGFAEGEGASYTYTGTQTDIGESENTFTYTLNDGTKAGNYDIVTANGKLTVETFPYAVTFNANGGSGAMEDLAFTYGQDAALTVNAFTRTGYTYQGWATSAEGEVVYTDGQTVGNLTMTPNGTVNLYAVWHPNAYTIRFLPNGAEGEMADQAMAYDTAVDLAANAFVKEGFWFVGWCAEGEEAVSYTNRQQVVNLATNDGAVVTLIAKWADAWYVDAANGDDANEGISAEQPFKTIQRAIDRAEEGQLIVVADGVYAPIASGDKAITIRSVNGAFATVIDGEGTAICANLGRAEATAAMTNTVLYGFTVRNGSSPLDAGGVLGGTVYNCLIVSNRAERCGGGAAWATLANCVIADNRALTGNGGGLYNSSANGCTVVGNVASVEGGGSFADISDVANNNCIVFGNTATRNAAIAGTVTKRGCFTGDPRFVDAANGDFRLKGDSPCIDMGNNRYVTGETDIRGNARIQNDIVDIGAYEFTLPAELGNVQVEGEDAAVPVEWLGAYGYVDEDSTAETLQPVMTQVGDNGIPLWESWVAGFDPWDSDSRLLAYIRAVGDEIEISWAPDLSNAEPKRYYTVIGKTNLTDSAWVTPVNEAHRFFKVRVSMSEPGLAKEVTATEGTSPVNVSLAWQAAKWALGYNIYRVAGDDFNRATLIASVTETEYVDATAVPGTLYTYWIVSTANGGEWVRSEPVSGYRKIGVPRHVSASDGSSTEWISVTWDAVEGAVSYRVLRATTGSLEEAVEVGTSTGTSWTDNDVESGVIYTYWVVAVGAGISSEVSSSDEGYLRLGVPGNVTATNGGFVDRVDVAWDPVTAASHYRVFRSTSASGSKTAVSEWQTGLTYSDTTAEAGVTYYYFVAAALDDMGLNASGYSAGVVGSLRLGAPTVYATDGTSASGVTVSWVEVPGAESYTVYRGTVNVPEAAQVVATTAEALFEDTTAEPGTLYYYWVVAANTVSESEWSVYETGFRSMAAPTGVTATTGSGADAVTISWTPVEGALFYRVYRGTRSGTVYAVEIDTTTETTYVDEGGAANRTYYYSVKAVGASCESDFSAFVPGSR